MVDAIAPASAARGIVPDMDGFTLCGDSLDSPDRYLPYLRGVISIGDTSIAAGHTGGGRLDWSEGLGCRGR